MIKSSNPSRPVQGTLATCTRCSPRQVSAPLSLPLRLSCLRISLRAGFNTHKPHPSLPNSQTISASALSALLAPSMDLCNDQGLNAAISKTANDMKAIHDEFSRVAMIAGADLRKRKVKEMASENPPKEPYATEEELAKTRLLTLQLRTATHSFVEACHELVAMRDTFGLRQAKRSALKRPVRHCRHCAGRRASCGCTDECPRTNSAIKCFLHCRHCVGDTEVCTCTSGCPNATRRTKCEKKAAPPTASSA